MATLSINGILQGQYRYDFAGRQAVRTLTSTVQTIHSVFDSSGNRIAEYDETSGNLLREYVWDGLTPVAVIENGAVYFVRVDYIGRPVFATNATGAKVWTAAYSPFGGVTATTGTPLALRFPGQWFQSESGLHQNWMRDYDPTTGRYLQADPIGLVDGASVYGYARQNPGRWIDPRGEDSGVPWDNDHPQSLLCLLTGVGCNEYPEQCTATESIDDNNIVPFPGQSSSGAGIDDTNDETEPSPPSDNCPVRFRALLLQYELILDSVLSGINPGAGIISRYIQNAKRYNAECVRKGWPALSTSFIRG